MPIRRKNIDFIKKFIEVSSDYSVHPEDEFILADATSGNLTITLPDSNKSKGMFYQIKKKDASNDLIIDGLGSETIDGAATLTLSTQYTTAGFISDGINWWRY